MRGREEYALRGRAATRQFAVSLAKGEWLSYLSPQFIPYETLRMSAQVVPAYFFEQAQLAAFVGQQLACGRAVVPCELEIELFDDVILRVEAGARSYDLRASVAHPSLPMPTGGVGLGLAVSLSDADRQALAQLEDALGDVQEAFDGIELSLDVEDLDVEGETAPHIERPELKDTVQGAPGPSPADLADLDYFFSETPLPLEPTPETPIATEVLEQLTEERTAPHSNTMPGLFHSTLQPTRRGSVDDAIDSALAEPTVRGAVDLDAGQESEAARYRALYPDKALRADEYYLAARADAGTGALELARTNANLAVAYNPTVAAYRDLLASVEERLGVKVR